MAEPIGIPEWRAAELPCSRAAHFANFAGQAPHNLSFEELRMSVTIRTRKNGPFVVEGEVTLIDYEGNPFTINTEKKAIALCRCGHSERKPFCDGTHNRCGFIGDDLATPPPAV